MIERMVTRTRLALALVGLLTILLSAACSGPGDSVARGEDEGTGAAAKPSDLKIVMFGLDGVTWRVLDPLLERGELPNLSKMIDNGARAELATLRPCASPRVWTSIATGKLPDKHGIHTFWREMEQGDAPSTEAEQAMIKSLEAIGYIQSGDEESGPQKVLYRTGDWEAEAFWEILGDYGYRSGIVGWWVTYPAEPIQGVMVSDRYAFNRFQLEAEVDNIAYSDEEQNVYPPELEPELRPLTMDIDEVDEELLSRFINGDVQISGEPVLHAREDELRVTLARDISHQRIARKLLEEHSPDLLSVYYEGTDIASHYFWKYRFPEEWEQMFPELPIDPDELTRYRDVINEYYRLVDEWMGELMQIAPEKTLFVALSDHGFMTGRRTKEGAGMARETVSGIHVRSNPPGVLIMSGHGVRKGAVVDRATILDLAPTMLAVMGAPVARDMDGKVLLSALEKDAFEHDLPASWVETFERPGEGAE